MQDRHVRGLWGNSFGWSQLGRPPTCPPSQWIQWADRWATNERSWMGSQKPSWMGVVKWQRLLVTCIPSSFVISQELWNFIYILTTMCHCMLDMSEWKTQTILLSPCWVVMTSFPEGTRTVAGIKTWTSSYQRYSIQPQSNYYCHPHMDTHTHRHMDT